MTDPQPRLQGEVGTARGRFIAFEGLDGSGKSTQVRMLAQRLRSMRYGVYETFEPTDGPVGSLVHQVMIHRVQLDPRAAAALFLSDRLDHITNPINGILRKINDGVHVLTDRYYLSSYAYHGVHAPLEWVIDANSICSALLQPDLHIYLDVCPEVCLRRIHDERFHLELYETADTMNSVRDMYFRSFDLMKRRERVAVLNGNPPAEEVSGDVWEAVKPLFRVVEGIS